MHKFPSIGLLDGTFNQWKTASCLSRKHCISLITRCSNEEVRNEILLVAPEMKKLGKNLWIKNYWYLWQYIDVCNILQLLFPKRWRTIGRRRPQPIKIVTEIKDNCSVIHHSREMLSKLNWILSDSWFHHFFK